MGPDEITIQIDDVEVAARTGQTILEAAQEAGIYIPRLCHHPDLPPAGHCRVCTVKINGKFVNSCIQTVTDGMVIENDTEELNLKRMNIVEMMFVTGNHFCSFCEASGRCELQAVGYRLGMMNPRYPYMYPNRAVDATNPEVYLDRNRCILCSRCIRASTLLDGKGAFGFEQRSFRVRLAVNSEAGLGGTGITASDRAPALCPTGALVPKHRGYDVPVGRRRWDRTPIGSQIENKSGEKPSRGSHG
jgi:[NiFe] hydrogenase diaphorase moiety small subunit